MDVTSNPFGAGYAVHLPVYDGPIALLLHLIERQELDITEVSLVAITNQYLRAIEAIQDIEPEALADFLAVAARLLYIKSRGLLPQPAGEEVEEKPSETLIQQLLDYRRFKAATDELRLRSEIGLRTNARLAPPPQVERRLDYSALTLEKLAAAAQRALRSFPAVWPRPLCEFTRSPLPRRSPTFERGSAVSTAPTARPMALCPFPRFSPAAAAVWKSSLRSWPFWN